MGLALLERFKGAPLPWHLDRVDKLLAKRLLASLPWAFQNTATTIGRQASVTLDGVRRHGRMGWVLVYLGCTWLHLVGQKRTGTFVQL